ncbi:MAG: response regulator [Anaerolineales bacterium]
MSAPKILVVDDSATARAFVRAALVRFGLQVVEASSGPEALTVLGAQPVDLVITDVVMPDMDGYELVRRIRKDPRTSAIPVLVLTSRGDVADKVAGFEAGADDYMVKPFEPAELEVRVKSLLARRGAAPAPAAVQEKPATIVAVFGCKGGVGTTTLAVNLALALRQITGEAVALIDADLSFGDVGLHLNVPPVHTINDLVQYVEELDTAMLAQAMVEHPSGIRVLLSPPRPERAEEVSARLIGRVLDLASRSFDYIVVDTQRVYDDRTLMVLDKAEIVLLVLTADIGALRNASLFLTLARTLGYPADKMMPVLNGTGVDTGIREQDVKRVLGGREPFPLESGGVEVALAANQGSPIMLTNPRNKAARGIRQLAERIVAER